MPHGETVSGLYEFLEGDLYATVELVDTGDGWVSEWWISRNVLGTYELQLLGYLRIPVFGEDVTGVSRRIHFIYEDVLRGVASWSGGVGDTGAGGDVVKARKHCKAHLQTWGDFLSAENKTEHTSALYSFAVEFGVNNPAALIAEIEGVGVRTVHDRIAYARRIGLLDSYGKGRIRNVTGDKENRYGIGGAFGVDDSEDEPINPDRANDILRRIFKHAGD